MEIERQINVYINKIKEIVNTYNYEIGSQEIKKIINEISNNTDLMEEDKNFLYNHYITPTLEERFLMDKKEIKKFLNFILTKN